MNIENIKNKLKENMTIEGCVHKRYYHSVEVANIACELVKVHNLQLNEEIVYISGILHDATKLLPKEVQKKMLYELGYKDDDEIMKSSNVWHGETAVEYIKKEYNIDNEDVLNAVKYHVMGRENMSDLEKVIFIADYVERTRIGKTFEEARELAFLNLDKALIYILKSQVEYLTSTNQPVISQTLKTYEYYNKGE